MSLTPVFLKLSHAEKSWRCFLNAELDSMGVRDHKINDSSKLLAGDPQATLCRMRLYLPPTTCPKAKNQEIPDELDRKNCQQIFRGNGRVAAELSIHEA